MMNHVAKTSLLLACVILLSACGQSGHGPGTWLDRPLHGMHFDLGPIILHAHASDADGISAILFYVDGDLVAEMDVSPGQLGLGEAIYQWDPPAVGTYTIHAVGVDGSSNRGSSSSVVITVGEITSPQPGPATQEVDAPQPSDTPTPRGPVPETPQSTLIPTPSDTPTPTKTPTATNTPDLAGPSILMEEFHDINYDHLESMVGGSPSGCGNKRLGFHALLLNDPAGIWSVWAEWYTIPASETGTVYYTTSDDYLWTGVYGPLSSHGVTLYFNGRANDNYGNYTEFSFLIPVYQCIG